MDPTYLVLILKDKESTQDRYSCESSVGEAGWLFPETAQPWEEAPPLWSVQQTKALAEKRMLSIGQKAPY